jgi:2Fe-2S ferredoxin
MPNNMPLITFVQPDGSTLEIEAPAGQSLMRAAIEANINGIQADCGGCLSCATCHVYIEAVTPLPPPDADEAVMLEAVAADRQANSRLSCQVVVSVHLDGATVRIPEVQ